MRLGAGLKGLRDTIIVCRLCSKGFCNIKKIKIEKHRQKGKEENDTN